MTVKIKSGAGAPDLTYVDCRKPIPTDRVVWNIDDPSARKAWLEVTAKLLRECERLVALDEASTSCDSESKTLQDLKVNDVEVLQRENE